MQNAFQASQDSYFDYSETIQEIFYRILAKPDVSLVARLFTLLCFARSAGNFLYPGTLEFSEEKLAREVDKVAGNVHEQNWLKYIQGEKVDLILPMSMIQYTLLGSQDSLPEDFKDLLQRLWSVYASDDDHSWTERFMTSDQEIRERCATIVQNYLACRDRTQEYAGSEIRSFLESYCTDFIFSKSYTEDTSLFDYAQRVVLHVALLKYLLHGHPDIQNRIREYDNKDLSREAEGRATINLFDGTVTGILQTCAKGAALNEAPLLRLRQEMARQNMNDLAHIALFLFF